MSATFNEVSVATTQAHPTQTADPSAPLDERARKRVEIGLSRERPTARRVVQRPPQPGRRRQESREHEPGRMWILTLLMAAILLATSLLVVARLLGAPTTWHQVATDLRAWRTGASVQISDAQSSDVQIQRPSFPLTLKPPRLLPAFILRNEPAPSPLASDFTRDAYAPESVNLSGERIMVTLPELGVYRIHVWPQNLAWTILTSDCLVPYTLQATASVDARTPQSYAALLGRFQGDEDFYLFAVNGEGAYRVQLIQAGKAALLQDWTESDRINLAGSNNLLQLSDDGRALTFSVNAIQLAVVENLALPIGATGIAAGAGAAEGEINFDSYQLQNQSCPLQ